MLNVFLAMFKGRLPKLRGHLRRGIVHELPIGAKDVARRAALLLVGRPAVALLMRLRRAGRRRRRPQLGHCGNVLRHGVVQRGRLPVRRPLHGDGGRRSGCARRVCLWACGRKFRCVGRRCRGCGGSRVRLRGFADGEGGRRAAVLMVVVVGLAGCEASRRATAK